MKKIRMIFSIVAIVLATAGVYASTLFATIYYVPSYNHRNNVACDIVIANPCSDSGSVNCTTFFTYMDPETGQPLIIEVLIGKRVDGGQCVPVFRVV